ncbi:MAG: N-acetylmuramoyl-L-alanine amidase [Alphaproteobacteria bacterium]|jgi:N-acetylmuramoyl-L-alanine amidase
MKKPSVIWRPSPNFGERSYEGFPVPINAIVIHGTGMKTHHDVLRRLRDPYFEVSAHYYISSTGKLYQLVKDEYKAWHAGVSAWGNMHHLNCNSIGIELFNTTAGNKKPYTKAQYETLAQLLHYLIETYKIPLEHVLGHSDIASIRETNHRTDPGMFFDWQFLYRKGLAKPLPRYKNPSAPLLWGMGYRGSYENRMRAYMLRTAGILM